MSDSERYMYRIREDEGSSIIATVDEFPLLSHVAEPEEEESIAETAGGAIWALRLLVNEVLADVAHAGEAPPPPLHRYEARAFPVGSDLTYSRCPAGWGPLTDEMIEALDRLAPGWRLRQVKSKFAEAAIYYDAPEGLSEEARAEIEVAREDLVARSQTTCEVCGAVASQVVVFGWLSALCPDHADVRGVPMADLRVLDE